MSPDAKGERPIDKAVDAIFQDTYGETTKGRIALAAHAITTYVNKLDVLEYHQRLTHEGVGSASRLDDSLRAIGYSAMFVPIVLPENDKAEKTDVDRIMELFDEDTDEHDISIFDPVKRAKLALEASVDGVRAVHHLSWFQSRRAIALSRRSLR